MSVHEMSALEGKITQLLKEAKTEITEVRIKFEPLDHDGKDH